MGARASLDSAPPARPTELPSTGPVTLGPLVGVSPLWGLDQDYVGGPSHPDLPLSSV